MIPVGCLEGKVLLVTGAARGIGRAEAELFAREGARLVLSDVGCAADGTGADASVVEQAAASLRETGADVVSDAGDATHPEHAQRLVQLARERFGRLDAVVASAGIRRDRSVLKMGNEDLDRLLDVHVRGAFALTRAAATVFTDQREPGAVVLHSAPQAFFGSARQSGMAAANAAIVGMARSAAVELRKHEIRVNVIVPTARTRLTEDLPLFRSTPEGSMSAEHVAPLAAFLASDLAADVTGEVVGVAGGRIYTFRARETTGAFVEGRAFTPEGVRDAWSEITRVS